MNSFVLYVINRLPLSENTTWRQSLCEKNISKLSIYVCADASETKFNNIPLVAAHARITI